jgi:hypothetical protein
MSVAFLAQHHPSRANELRRMLASCPGTPFVVVTDPDPDGKRSAWRTYRACLNRIPPAVDHAVIVQDDAVCVPGFADAARVACEARPDALIAFFHPVHPPIARQAMFKALKARQPFWEIIPRGRFVPTVALAWPRARAAEFVEWADDVKRVRPDSAGDDNIVGEWANKHNVLSLVTAPSIVEHPDDRPSLLRSRVSGRRTAIAVAGHADEWVNMLSMPAA